MNFKRLKVILKHELIFLIIVIMDLKMIEDDDIFNQGLQV